MQTVSTAVHWRAALFVTLCLLLLCGRSSYAITPAVLPADISILPLDGGNLAVPGR